MLLPKNQKSKHIGGEIDFNYLGAKMHHANFFKKFLPLAMHFTPISRPKT